MITLQNSGVPVYLQIYDSIRDDIVVGRLAVGSRLDAERVLARKLNVNRSTVSHAYQKLHDEGYLTSKQGGAHIVAQRYPQSDIDVPPSWDAARIVSPLTYAEHNSGLSFDDGVYRRAVNRREEPNSYYFMGTMVPHELCPTELINKTVTGLIEKKGHALYDYCTSQGLDSLRAEICRHVQKKRIDATPGRVVIGHEIVQLLDFLLHVYIKPGDILITEEPIFIHVYQLYKLHHARVITIPMDEEGIRADLLEKELKQHKPKLICVTSSHHNPTNISMSLSRRIQLLDLARRYEVPVVEQTFSDELEADGETIPPLKALDPDDFVVYIGGFTASFSQSVPISYAIANPRTISAVVKMVQMTIYQIDTLSQHIMEACLADGTYDQHLTRVRKAYQEKQAALYQALDQCKGLGLSYCKGAGGSVVWCRLPDNVDARKLIKRAREENIYYHPGELFYPNGRQGRSYIRLSFMYPTVTEIREGVAKLACLIQEQQIHSSVKGAQRKKSEKTGGENGTQ